MKNKRIKRVDVKNKMNGKKDNKKRGKMMMITGDKKKMKKNLRDSIRLSR